MITHLIKSINWVDVGLALLFLRVIFIGVRNGFVSEFFKSLGAVTAVYVSLHYYAFVAAWAAHKTNFACAYWNLAVFIVLWFAVTFFFKIFRDGILILFKVEANHQGFDKYAAGILAVGRGLLVVSLAIFMILLIQNAALTKVTMNSYSYKIASRAAVDVYRFLYNNLVDKLLTGQHYNAQVSQVLHPEISTHRN